MAVLSDSVKAVVVPSQPDHLSTPVKRLMDSMYENPSRAYVTFNEWQSKYNNERSLKGARFRGLSLPSIHLSGYDLQQAEFDNCDLRGSVFRKSDLSGTRFVAVQFDRETEFLGPESIHNCSMERYALACLGPEHGGLTEGNLMDMKIVDHVADLRLRFSGIWAWIHLISIAVFFFPFIWFLFIQWGRAKWALSPDHSVTIWTAFWRYIWNGGRDWQTGWHLDFWSVFRFVGVLFYQIIRITLLAKTKSLEMTQVVTGLPAKFSLDQASDGWEVPVIGCRIGEGFRWRWALRFVGWFMWFTVVLALWNSIHFLNMRVPA